MKPSIQQSNTGFDFDELSVRLFISTGILMIAVFLGILVLRK